MATLYGDQFSDAYVEVPSSKINSPDFNGLVKVLYFTYPIPSVVPSNADVIKLARLPKGARVLDAVLLLPDLGDTTVLELGWAASLELNSSAVTVEAADPDGLLAAIDGDVAADSFSMQQAQEAGGALAGHLKKFSGEVDIQITVTDAWTSTTTTDSIKGYIKYAL
jgi:hypothetical protein